MIEGHEGFQEVMVQKQDIGRLLENLDIRNAMGLDGVSSWTLRECEDQLIHHIWEIIIRGKGTTRVEES